MRPFLSLALTLAALAALPAAASASTSLAYFAPGQSSPPAGDPFGMVIHGDADPTLTNIRMLESPTRFRIAVLRPDNTFAPTVVGTGCVNVTSVTECNEAGSLLVTANLGAGNDSVSENSLGAFTAILKVDGEAGNDTMTGGRLGDALTGGDGNDMLSGNNGSDTLTGGAGNDTITGGANADTIKGGTGGDTINSRDGIKDTVVDCGGAPKFGPTDRLTADLADKPVNCAIFTKFAADDGPPSQVVSTKLAIKKNGRATLRVKCPKDAKVRCRGTLVVPDPDKAAQSFASVAYDIALAETASVTVALTAAEAQRLRGRGTAVIATVEAGKSKLGDRSSQTTLPVP